MSTGSRHLAPEEIAGYQQRTLAPDDLLQVSDHLARCGVCRTQLDSAERLGEAVGALRADLANAEELGHPTLDEVAAFVDDRLEAIEREIVASHLEICAVCAEDVEDLRAVRVSLRRAPVEPASTRKLDSQESMHLSQVFSPRRRRGKANTVTSEAEPQLNMLEGLRRSLASSRRWLGYAAVTALAAGLAAFAVWIGIRPAPAPDQPHRVAAPVVESPALLPSGLPPLVRLNDGGGTVTLHVDGTASGFPALAEDESVVVRVALKEGRVSLPPLVTELRSVPGTLMSARSDASLFQPLRPLSTAVETDRPLFEWTRLSGATAYVVSIFERDFSKVGESPRLEATSWRLDRPLDRGRTYLWQVRATRADEDIVAPAPPGPEARFHVLSDDDAARLAGVRQRYRNFHLVLGILLAQAGALDEAERELESLVAANPGAPVPKQLLDGVRAERTGRAERR